MTQFLMTQENRLRELIARLTDREEGQDMVEYALWQR